VSSGSEPGMRKRIWSSATLLWLSVGILLILPTQTFGQPADKSYVQEVLGIQRQIEDHDLAGARASIAAALEKYPGNGGLENLLGIIDIQQGDPVAARRVFSAAVRHDPHLSGAMLNLARLDLERAASDPAAAAEALALDTKVLQLEPRNDEANYQAATLLAYRKSYRDSLEHLHRLSTEALNQIGAQVLLCSDAALLGSREATNNAAEALAAHPELTEEDVQSCLPALRTAHRADLITKLFEAAQQHRSLSPSGLRVLGLAQEAEGALPQARATLERAFDAGDQSVPLLIDLTRVAQAAGDHQGALGYLAHARQLDPQNAGLAYEFGAICLNMGLFAEARKALEEAVKLQPGNADYNFGLGTVISYSEDPSQALPYLRKFHELRPQDAKGLLALGTASYRAKDYEAAIPWLKQASASQPTAAEAHFYLGRIARQEGHATEATAELKQSLALQPDQAGVLAELGQICVNAHDFAQATTYLQHALQLDPDNYAANFGLLQLYARTGDARLNTQSKRFDQIKQKQQDQEQQMMRMIEIRPGN